MSLRLFALVCWLVAFTAGAEILPPRPATQTEVNAGTDSVHPVTPKTLGGFSIVVTNLPLATATNIAQNVSDTSSNLVWGNIYFTKTNAFSGNAFAVGTNKTYVGSSAINLSSIVGAKAGNYSVGELSVVASGGSITITNPASWNTNLTWTVADGHRAECAMKVQLGLFTNFVVYVQ